MGEKRRGSYRKLSATLCRVRCVALVCGSTRAAAGAPRWVVCDAKREHLAG